MKTKGYSNKIMTFQSIFLHSFIWAKVDVIFERFIFHQTFNWLTFYGRCASHDF